MKTMKTLAAITTTAALASFTLAPANAQQPNHHPGQAQAGKTTPGGAPGTQMKPGMKAKGGKMMGQSGMMGKGGMMGMMHKKMHQKMMGKKGFMRAKAFTAADVARIVDGKLSMRGFTRLKAANVKIKDDKTATADIVSPKGELIARITVNRNNGMSKIVE